MTEDNYRAHYSKELRVSLRVSGHKHKEWKQEVNEQINEKHPSIGAI